MDIRAIYASLALTALMACGGGGGGSSPAPAPQPSAGITEGAWSGSIHSTATGQTMSAAAMVIASGETRYVASNGVQAVGTINATGTSFTGSGSMYGPTGFVFPGGSNTAALTLSGTGTSGASMSGSYSGGGDTGTFTFTYAAGAQYTSAIVMANMAGSYGSVATSSGYSTTGRLTNSGAISGSDAYGSFTGTLTAVDPAKNAFRVNVTYTLNGGATYTYSGLAFFDLSVSPVQLNIQTTGTAGQFAAVFARTGP